MRLWVCLASISLACIGPSPLSPLPSFLKGGVRALDFQANSHLAIESVRLEVFDLSGRRIFSSGPVPGATYKWYLQRDDGRPVANGVYLYIFLTRTSEGKELVSSAGKIAVRR